MSSVYGFMFLSDKKNKTTDKILKVVEGYAKEESVRTLEWYKNNSTNGPQYDISPIQSLYKDSIEGCFHYYNVGSVYTNGIHPKSHLSKPTRMFTDKSLNVFLDCNDKNAVYVYNNQQYGYNVELLLKIISETKGMKKNNVFLHIFKSEEGKCKRIQSKVAKEAWTGKFL